MCSSGSVHRGVPTSSHTSCRVLGLPVLPQVTHWGDRRPAVTRGWASRAPWQLDLSFLCSSMAEGPRLRRGLALLPAVCRPSVPTPSNGDRAGSRGPRTAPASSPSPAASPALALAATMLANGGSGWEMGRTEGPRFSPRTRTHHAPSVHAAVWGWHNRRTSAPPVSSCDPSWCWALLPRPQRDGRFMGPVSAGKVSGLWLRTRRPEQDIGQSPPHRGQAQPGWTHFGALLASVAT